MIDEVMQAVAATVRRSFADMPVFIGKVDQGLKPPCFCICCERPEMERFLGGRWRCRLPLTLYCFPGSGREQELCAVFEELYHALELIDCGGFLRAARMDAAVRDGVGVFCADYDFFVRWTEKDGAEGGVMLELKLMEKQDMDSSERLN